MYYFKTGVSCIFAAVILTGVTITGFSAAKPSVEDTSVVQTVESVVVDEACLEQTDWYRETEYGSYIVSTPYGSLETIIHPTSMDFSSPVNEDYSESMINEIESMLYVSPESDEVLEKPEFDPSTPFDVTTYQVNKSYNIPKEFYYATLPEDMHCLVEGICNLERTQEISSMFLFAVAATEVGWHGEFAGDNNWFNWTPDAENYQGFATTEDCIAYTGNRFQSCYFNPEWYAGFGQEMDAYFTVSEINSRYAFYNDGSVNWYWGEVVTEILESLNTKYVRWVSENYG